MNKNSIAGTGQVFSFTLRQMLKNKGNIIVTVIISIIIMAAIPLGSLISAGAEAAPSGEMGMALPSYNTAVMTVDEYFNKDAGNFVGTMVVQYIYSIVLMLVSTFTSIHIVRTVVEEKASKLVDTLMVSVKPMALIFGKILAVMAYIFSTVIIYVASYFISYLVTGIFLDTSFIGRIFDGMGVDFSSLNISPLTVVVALVSLILAYFTFSIIAGISGASCSTMEQVEGANMTVTLIIMFGYIVSFVTPAFENNIVTVTSCLFPVISLFSAPANFTAGNIGFGLLAASWVIQAAVVVLLLIFCSRVYSGLIMHSGNRIKMRQIIAMSSQNTAKEAN